MGVLVSKLFTEGDPATVKKLEDCATGKPSEVQSHFKQGHANARGEHIRRVQEALALIRQREPGLGIPDFQVNGVYDDKTAKAVRAYKEKRGIRNYANRIDDVVGIKTIRSLDNDARLKPRVEPPPRPSRPTVVPRPLPRIRPGSCLPDAECPTSREFVIQLIVGGTGGEILEAAFLTFMIQDQKHGLACLYSLSGGGVATPGLPINPMGAGSPRPFTTSIETKVTRFGPIGGITGVTIGPPGSPVDPHNVNLLSVLTFSFTRPGSAIPAGTVILNRFDTGPISIQGAGIHGGRFKAHGICRGGLGADRTI
jgi:hypothetical protein